MAIIKINTKSTPVVTAEPINIVKSVDVNAVAAIGDRPPIIPEFEPTFETESIPVLDGESNADYLERLKSEIVKIKQVPLHTVEYDYDGIQILNKYNPVNITNGELSLLDLFTFVKNTYGQINHIIEGNDSIYKSLIDANTLSINSVYQEVQSNTGAIETVSTSFNVRMGEIEATVETNKQDVDGEINTINQLIIDQEGIILSAVQSELDSFSTYISQNYATLTILNDSISSLVGRNEFNSLGNIVISNQSSIVQLSNEISLSVTQIEFDALGNEVSSNTAAITINSNRIDITVDENGELKAGVIVDAINGGTTTIFANKINIDGTTTFSAGYDPYYKNTMFLNQPTVPYREGDTWIKVDGLLYTSTVDKITGVFDENDWVHGLSYSGDEAIQNFIDNVYNPDQAALQADLDGKIEYWFQSTDPTLDPNWGDPNSRIGDVWHNEVTKNSYNWVQTNAGQQPAIYAWVRIEDIDAINALNDAAEAQDTADGKRRVFMTTPVGPYDIGDLWMTSINPSEGDIFKCITANPNPTYIAADWVDGTKYTDDTESFKKSTIWRDSVVDPSTIWTGSDLDHVGDIWYTEYDFGGTVGVEVQPHYWNGTAWVLDVVKIDGGRINAGSVTADKIIVDELFAETIYASGAQIGGVDISPQEIIDQGIDGLRLGNLITFSPTAGRSGVMFGEQNGSYKMFIGNETDNIVFDGGQLLLSGFPMIGSGTQIGIGEFGDYFEVINRNQANEYIKCKIDFASQGEITSYTADGYNLPTLWEAMPIASGSILGGIKVGNNLTIDPDGKLNAEAGGGTGSWNDITDKPHWLDHSTISAFEGGHAHSQYLTSFTESDPTVPSHVKSITTNDKINWNTAFGWGNHASVGYSIGTHTHTYLNNYVSINKSSAATEALDVSGNVIISNNSWIKFKNSTGSVVRMLSLTDSNDVIIGGADGGQSGNVLIYRGGYNNVKLSSAGLSISKGNVNVSDATEALDVSGNIKASGEVTAYSDSRLKFDKRRITNALSLIDKVHGYTYTKDGRRSAGIIAQEIREILPEAIHGVESHDSYLSVNDAALSGLFIEGLKELDKKVDSNTHRLNELEIENKEFKRLLNIK